MVLERRQRAIDNGFAHLYHLQIMTTLRFKQSWGVRILMKFHSMLSEPHQTWILLFLCRKRFFFGLLNFHAFFIDFNNILLTVSAFLHDEESFNAKLSLSSYYRSYLVIYSRATLQVFAMNLLDWPSSMHFIVNDIVFLLINCIFVC